MNDEGLRIAESEDWGIFVSDGSNRFTLRGDSFSAGNTGHSQDAQGTVYHDLVYRQRRQPSLLVQNAPTAGIRAHIGLALVRLGTWVLRGDA